MIRKKKCGKVEARTKNNTGLTKINTEHTIIAGWGWPEPLTERNEPNPVWKSREILAVRKVFIKLSCNRAIRTLTTGGKFWSSLIFQTCKEMCCFLIESLNYWIPLTRIFFNSMKAVVLLTLIHSKTIIKCGFPIGLAALSFYRFKSSRVKVLLIRLNADFLLHELTTKGRVILPWTHSRF